MAQRLGQKSSKGSSSYRVVGTGLLARTLGKATGIPTSSLSSVRWTSSQHGCSVTRTNFPREEMEWKPRHFCDLASEVMQHHFCYVLFIRAQLMSKNRRIRWHPHMVSDKKNMWTHLKTHHSPPSTHELSVFFPHAKQRHSSQILSTSLKVLSSWNTGSDVLVI